MDARFTHCALLKRSLFPRDAAAPLSLHWHHPSSFIARLDRTRRRRAPRCAAHVRRVAIRRAKGRTRARSAHPARVSTPPPGQTRQTAPHVRQAAWLSRLERRSARPVHRGVTTMAHQAMGRSARSAHLVPMAVSLAATRAAKRARRVLSERTRCRPEHPLMPALTPPVPLRVPCARPGRTAIPSGLSNARRAPPGRRHQQSARRMQAHAWTALPEPSAPSLAWPRDCHALRVHTGQPAQM